MRAALDIFLTPWSSLQFKAIHYCLLMGDRVARILPLHPNLLTAQYVLQDKRYYAVLATSSAREGSSTNWRRLNKCRSWAVSGLPVVSNFSP